RPLARGTSARCRPPGKDSVTEPSNKPLSEAPRAAAIADLDAAPRVGSIVEQTLRSARELLGMDIAWIAELAGGKKVFRALDGDGASFGLAEGDEMPADTSYCQRLVLGVIPNRITDTG